MRFLNNFRETSQWDRAPHQMVPSNKEADARPFWYPLNHEVLSAAALFFPFWLEVIQQAFWPSFIQFTKCFSSLSSFSHFFLLCQVPLDGL